ncbi:MAG: efflux RND transporter permease subunit [Polyangia bacterium]
MSISSLSVRRGVTFGMVFAAIFGFGVYSLSRLQLDLYPETTFPVVMILTEYTGASPEDVESLITEPIESAVAAAEGVEELNSKSKQGSSVVMVEFGWDEDMDQAETDVRRKLELVEGLLPDDAEDPLVIAMDPSMQPIAMLTLEGSHPSDELRRIAEDEVCARVERLDGVASCDVMGGLDREIRVALDPASLAAHGLDALAVLGAIGRENVEEPGGTIEQNGFAFEIRTEGRFQSLEEIRDVVVGRRAGADGKMGPILLGQVAEVRDTFAEKTNAIEVGGEPSVWINVRKQSGRNTVRAAEATIAEIRRFERESDGRLRFGVIMNQADFINKSLGNLSTTALIAVGISLVVLLVFLGNLRSALVVSSAIPLSVVATFFIMDQAGMTLNVISMAGLALAVGMLVDNAIVVLENIFRLREQGLPLRPAAIEGAAEMSTAVGASTLTTVSVFVPVLFVPGIAGVLFEDMAVTICFALLVSLLVAISFVPLAASRILGDRKGLSVRGRSVSRWNPVSHLQEPYARLLRWVLARRWVVVVGLALSLAFTGLLAGAMPTEFMPEQDQSLLQLDLEAPVGSDLELTRDYVHEAIASVREVIPKEHREMIAANIGTGSGFSALFSEGMHFAGLTIPLSGVTERDLSQAEYEDRLREELSEIPDVSVSIGGMDMTGGEGDMEIEIRGYDLDELRRVGGEIEQRIEAMPRVGQVDFSFADPTPQLAVRYDREKMAEIGLSTSSVGRAIAISFLGKTAALYSEKGDEHEVVVRYDERHRNDVEQLRRMPVGLAGGETIPLGNVVEIGLQPGPISIERADQERITTLDVTLEEAWIDSEGNERTKDLGAAIGEVRELLEDWDWPEKMGFEVGGSAEDFIESFTYLGLALALSVLLVYMVMAGLFESFRQPFIIIFTVPLALIGVVLIFVLSGSSIDVTALIGVIMLVGIAVNNGIVMVDAANRRRREGLDRFAAIVDAARTRLRPVLLTSTTTICSMIPLALEIGEGSESWSSMARAVIGGLLTATVLTLVVVPTFYTVFARKGREVEA